MAPKTRGRQPRARAEAVALRRRASRRRSAARFGARFTPSPRSILAGLAIAVLGVGGYLFALKTSTFAIRTVQVTGAPAPLKAQVQRTLAPFVGSSLVGLDGGRVLARVEELPAVVRARYDRAFPHTLRVSVVPERIVAVVRRGAQAWLVSARGRVVQRIARDAHPGLPRIWLPAATSFEAGSFLQPDRGGDAARALSFTSRFPPHVVSAETVGGSLVFHLRSGVAVRLGDPDQIRLKLAVARLALRDLPAGTTYLDVGLPGRPVAGNDAVATTPPPTTVQTTTTQTATAQTTQPASTSAASTTQATTTSTTPNPQVSTGG